MRIAIIGTRGIPNHYGGFEQCAEYLALGLVKLGHSVIVYNSHNHPYQEASLLGVEIIHCYDPEVYIGTAGQFLYDLNCILDVRKQNCDIILQLGYTSSSIWGRFLPKNSVVTTNMDGMEWRRSKFSSRVRRFILKAEGWGVKHSDYLIADSIGIKDYLKKKYSKESSYIAYGATLFNDSNKENIVKYTLEPFKYNMLIARLEPENSIDVILEGVAGSNTSIPFLVVGKNQTPYGKYLMEKFNDYPVIRFVGGIYDINELNNLRYFSNLYFHGHTVGGTNPSLLEAMASNALICANDNPFNRYILGEDALYFLTAEDVTHHLNTVVKDDYDFMSLLKRNQDKIINLYDWDIIVKQYEQHMYDIKDKILRNR